jgi:hypothetical protein
MTDYQVFDIRTEPETDAGIYEASSEQEAINAAVKEFAGNDNSPEVDDLRAERLQEQRATATYTVTVQTNYEIPVSNPNREARFALKYDFEQECSARDAFAAIFAQETAKKQPFNAHLSRWDATDEGQILAEVGR